MLVIPLQAIAAQEVQTTLNGQAVVINLYQKSTGLFCDVTLNGVLLVAGVICQNLNRIVRDAYLGFPGDLFFQDTQGTLDPSYSGLGARFLLYYAAPGEI